MRIQLSTAPEMSRRPPVKGDKAQSKEKRPVKEEMRLSGKVMEKQKNKIRIKQIQIQIQIQRLNIIILLYCEVINRRVGLLYFTHAFCQRYHSRSSASFWVWLSSGTCGLYLGYSFVSRLAGSRSGIDLDLLSVVNHLLGLSSSLEGICWVFPMNGFPRTHLVFMLVSFPFFFQILLMIQ